MKEKLLSMLLFIAVPFMLMGQGINYTRSWLGTTFNGPEYMSNFIDRMEVSPDGSVHGSSGWDEIAGGGRFSTYKNGQIIDHKGFAIHGASVTDKNGVVWTIQNQPDDNYPVGHYSDTIKSSDNRFITDAQGPSSLAIDNDGKLIVGEFGHRGQVRFYDISGVPKFDHAFGDSLGFIGGPVPGRLGPLRFREIKGVGTDQSGNIYVGMSCFFGGCKLQSYTPQGNKNWELNGLLFVDNADFDPTTDGKDIYTKSHHISMDYSKPAGMEWKDTAYTINRFKYLDDPRLHILTKNPTVVNHPSSTVIRYSGDKKIMFVNDMFNEQLRMYRFNPATDGETAIPSGLYAQFNVKPWAGNIRHFLINNDSIYAKNFSAQSGGSPGTNEVGGIRTGNYLVYDNVDFGNTDTSTFTVNYSCVDPWTPSLIQLYADSINGRLLGAVQGARTGGNDIFKLFSAKLSDTITGVHRVVLLFTEKTPRWPFTQPSNGQWIWTDKNGNGQMDKGEYQNINVDIETKAWWVDKALNIWRYTTTGIVKVPFTGLDGEGNPTYNLGGATTTPTPADFILGGSDNGRLEYDSDNDIMYLVTSKNKAGKFSHWSTNTTVADWEITTTATQSMCVAGDYLFLIAGNEQVSVYKLSDGSLLGKMAPHDKVNGIIDIPYGIKAMKRSNGEYVVLAEEDYLGKVVVYRFTPDAVNQKPTVSISTPVDNQKFTTSSIPVEVLAADADGAVDMVYIYLDGKRQAPKGFSPYTFNLSNVALGEHILYAKAVDNYGDTITSDTVHFKVEGSGIPDALSNNLRIFPNPASDIVSLKVPEGITLIKEISIIDQTGRTIVKKNSISVNGSISEINVSGISDGIYILRVTSGSMTKCLQLIIKK